MCARIASRGEVTRTPGVGMLSLRGIHRYRPTWSPRLHTIMPADHGHSLHFLSAIAGQHAEHVTFSEQLSTVCSCHQHRRVPCHTSSLFKRCTASCCTVPAVPCRGSFGSSATYQHFWHSVCQTGLGREPELRLRPRTTVSSKATAFSIAIPSHGPE